MALTEEKLYEAFGLEVPAEEPAEKPAQEQGSEPAEKEGADSAVQPNTEPDADSENDDADEGGSDGKKPLTPEQRRQNAARRREIQQQEQQAAINAAVESAVQQERQRQETERQALVASLGLKDDAGEPITTAEQLQKWQQGHSAKRLEQDLKNGKLTPEALEAAIGNHPAVRQAQLLVEQAQRQAQAQQEVADQQRIAEDLEKIRQRDPSVQTVADLLKLPESDAFREYVRKGHSFDDAHYLATRERREREAAEAARQKALNDARSKDHLTGTGGARGTGAVTVPGDVMALYRKLNPKASEAEIIAHYNKHMKK